MTARSALLLLTDGRLPAGGHAHSHGAEAFVASGELYDLDSLGALLDARMCTNAVVDACFAAAGALAARRHPCDWSGLDAEAGARIASPAVRAASRTLGRQLARTARAMWEHPTLADVALVHADGPHHSIAIGAVATVAGIDAHDAALAAAYGVVTQPANAALRLLGLDPGAVQALVARRTATLDEIAALAVTLAHERAPRDLPAPAAVRADFAAERHSRTEVRLFAS